jgi:hypothetical protein
MQFALTPFGKKRPAPPPKPLVFWDGKSPLPKIVVTPRRASNTMSKGQETMQPRIADAELAENLGSKITLEPMGDTGTPTNTLGETPSGNMPLPMDSQLEHQPVELSGPSNGYSAPAASVSGNIGTQLAVTSNAFISHGNMMDENATDDLHEHTKCRMPTEEFSGLARTTTLDSDLDQTPSGAEPQQLVGSVYYDGKRRSSHSNAGFFYIYFIAAKIYDPLKVLQKYTSVVVAHGVKDITSWAAALGAASSGPLPLTPQATALGA